MLVAVACLYAAAIIDGQGDRGKHDKEHEMTKDRIARRLAVLLEDAAPSAMPESTKGYPGGMIDWDKFAAAIVEAVEELLHADPEKQTEEVHLKRVENSGKGRADT